MRITLAFILASALSASGETLHVAQTAAGADTGADAANAHSLAWLNTAANWGGGAGEVDPGDTVILNGTFTSTLTVAGSGTAGNIITIQFATGAKFSKNVWGLGSAAAIYTTGKSYITLDGGTNGKIETTDNGTLLTNQTNCTGVEVVAGNQIIVKNLTVGPMYLRDPGSTTDGTRLGNGITMAGSNLTVQDCTCFGGDGPLSFTYNTGSQSNWTIQRNNLYDGNHLITIGTNSAGSILSDVVIEDNNLHDLDSWDGHASIHLDGMIIFDEDLGYTSSFSGLVIRNNTIGPGIGTINTAGIFFANYESNSTTGMRIYNNLFLTDDGKYWNNGCLTIGAGLGTIVAHNTFYQLGSSPTGIAFSGATGDDYVFRNNLIYNFGTAINMGSRTPAYPGAGSLPPSATINNNVYYNLPAGSGPFVYGGWVQDTTAGWLGLAQGYDANSVFTQPTLDASYVPTAADTVAKNTGVNLSATYPWLATDKNGVTRTDWYAGAYEYLSDIPFTRRVSPRHRGANRF